MTQSITALARKLAMLTVSIGAASLLPACGMSSLTSGLGSSVFSGGSSTSTTTTGAVNEEQLLTAAKDGDLPGVAGTEVSAGCPKFVPWPRDNFITVYEQNRVGDSAARLPRPRANASSKAAA
jgi:hypothetical protein